MSISPVCSTPVYPSYLPKTDEVTPSKNEMVPLFFSIMKVLFIQNTLSMMGNREQIINLDQQNTLLHEKQIEEIKAIHASEKSSSAWSTAMSVFSWMTSFTEILAGAFLIASGNVVSGALLLAGGIIQLTSQIMQITGGWNKVAEMIPGDDFEEKKAIVTWMQIGIGIISLMLGGAGGVLSGKEAVSEGMSMANMFIGSVSAAGMGICNMGTGINGNELYQARHRAKLNEVALEKIRMERRNLMENSETRVERVKEIIAAIGFAIRIVEEQNRANQRLMGG